jgi:hypothetical protein
MDMFNINNLHTGDILLFEGKSLMPSILIEKLINSKFSHVGIVLRDPIYIDPSLKGFYLLESGAESFPDAVDNKKKFGVMISDLFKVIGGYNGCIYWRQLHANIDNIDMKIKEIYDSVKDIKYDLNIFDALDVSKQLHIDTNTNSCFAKYLPNIFNHRKLHKFFCSALVAYVYTKLGLLPEKLEWTRCEPGTFSFKENPKLYIIDATLDKEININ